MVKQASSPRLKGVFHQHARRTALQVKRIDLLLNRLGKKPKKSPRRGMQAIVQEVRDLIRDQPKWESMDAALVALAQKMEWHQMECYGSAYMMGKLAGHREDRVLLQKSLDEEKVIDEQLANLPH